MNIIKTTSIAIMSNIGLGFGKVAGKQEVIDMSFVPYVINPLELNNMITEELNYIKDAFSQIIDDIAGNPDWHEAARAVASDLGTLERKLEEKISSFPSNLDEAAEEYKNNHPIRAYWLEGEFVEETTSLDIAFKAGAEWMAGQGYTVEGVARPDDCEVWVNLTNTNIKDGDKVIVQIRKK